MVAPITITWETLTHPAVMGALIALFMQAFGKRLARWLAGLLKPDQNKLNKVRGIAINVVTVLMALGLTSIRLSANWSLEPVIRLAIIAAAYSIGEYEALKNIFRMLGWKVEGMSGLTPHRGWEAEGS